ncbi:MAG: isochorismatase family protein [Mediterraneibacter gnavus]
MSKSALIIVDMVRDFTDPEGLVYYPQNREILPQIRKCWINAGKRGTGRIYATLQSKRKSGQKSPGNEAKLHRRHFWSGGSHSMLPVDEEKDYVIKKRDTVDFFGTDLDLVLRENGVRECDYRRNENKLAAFVQR